jgi:hypothetical protein
MYSWLTYIAVLILFPLRILYPKQEKEDPALLKTEDFYFSLDIRPNENPALKISFTSNALPLELNHIEFSALAYYCKGYPNKGGNFEVDVVDGWQLKETRFFSFKPGNSGFRIDTARVTNDSNIISRRTIVFRNIEPSTIKTIGDAYDSYLVRNVFKMTFEQWRERNTVLAI